MLKYSGHHFEVLFLSHIVTLFVVFMFALMFNYATISERIHRIIKSFEFSTVPSACYWISQASVDYSVFE